jgi:hypothetical protein
VNSRSGHQKKAAALAHRDIGTPSIVDEPLVDCLPIADCQLPIAFVAAMVVVML